MTELVCHHPHRMGKAVHPLYRTELVRDPDHPTPLCSIFRLILPRQSERRDPRRGRRQKPPGNRPKVQKQEIHVPIVVTRVGDPVRTIVVVSPEVHLAIHLCEDLLGERTHPILQLLPQTQVVSRAVQGSVSFFQTHSGHRKLTARHLPIEMREAPRNIDIEQIVCVRRGPHLRRRFVPEPGEDGQKMHVSLGGNSAPSDILPQHAPTLHTRTPRALEPGHLRGHSGRHDTPDQEQDSQNASKHLCSTSPKVIGVCLSESKLDGEHGKRMKGEG